MSISTLFIITIAIAGAALGIGNLTTSIQAQTLTTSDLPMTTINETNTNSTVDVLNKTLPAENATDAVPVVPM